MWSNGGVADEDPDESSPWSRDDWLADSPAADESVFTTRPDPATAVGPPTTNDGRGVGDEPSAADFEVPVETSPRSSLGRKVIAAVVVVALLIGSGGALLRCGGDDTEEDSAATSNDEVTRVTAEPGLETIPPATARTTTVPLPDPASETVASDSLPPLVVGEVPAWVERTIDVPERLATIASTEVVTLSQSGIVSVTEFPSGRDRSVDVSGMGSELQLALGDRTVVVFDSTTLVQIRDGEPVVESTLSDGIIFVQPWRGTGNFVVTTPATGPDAPERDWVLRPDGTLEPLDNPFVDETTFFSRVFSPNGDALVTAPGGVYAIDPAGVARRISTGTLIASGARHWAIEECDETLRCAHSVIAWDTDEVTPGVLDEVEQFGFIDPATHISPDGRSIAFRAPSSDGSGRRAILDVATGDTLEAGRINQVIYPDTWATDSSGLFFPDRFLQFVDRATGSITEVTALDRIRSVTTGEFATDGAAD
jgi:hypothetical protein